MSGTSTVLGPGDDDHTSPEPFLSDTIFGADGNDTLNGESSDDYLSGDNGADRLLGGSENDTLLGGDDNDTLAGSAGDDSLIGGAGDDILYGDNFRLGDGLPTTGDVMDGGTGNDTIIGAGYGLATMNGGEGDDYLLAGPSGDRVMIGGGGNDTFADFSNNSIRYIDGTGGGSDVVAIDGFSPASLIDATGTIDIGGTSYAYQQVYNSNGYLVYFGNYSGAIVCFAAGTMIMTADGERRIETLRAGDLVVAASGQGARLKPVRWIGRREVNLGAHPRPDTVAPVLVMAGALGSGVPHRALCVSPDHALLVDGVLVPAKCLLDGETIRQLPARGRVTYFHVELDTHDIILADGAPVESYMDRGNRGAFGNASAVQMLHADFTPKHLAGGMPVVTEGPALEKARRFLASRRREAADVLRRTA